MHRVYTGPSSETTGCDTCPETIEEGDVMVVFLVSEGYRTICGACNVARYVDDQEGDGCKQRQSTS